VRKKSARKREGEVFPLPRVFPPRREKERDMVNEKERVVMLLHVQTCTQILDEEGNCSKKRSWVWGVSQKVS
jgi:hypothetical protein